MNNYEMGPASIVQDIEWTRFCPQTDGQTHRQMDEVKPYTPLSTSMKVSVWQIRLTAVI